MGKPVSDSVDFNLDLRQPRPFKNKKAPPRKEAGLSCLAGEVVFYCAIIGSVIGLWISSLFIECV
jgi:hypothetical protein